MSTSLETLEQKLQKRALIAAQRWASQVLGQLPKFKPEAVQVVRETMESNDCLEGQLKILNTITTGGHQQVLLKLLVEQYKQEELDRLRNKLIASV